MERRGLLIAAGVAALAAACGAARPTTHSSQPKPPAPSPARTPSPPPTATATPRGPAHEIASGERASKQVALTFHVAGDPAIVSAVLDAAHRAKATLTMLVVGQWLEQNPRYAEKIVAGGHDLGNHTWSHPVLADDDPHQTRLEVVKCRDLLIRLTGTGGRWFRPSGTQHATTRMLQAAGEAGYPTSLSYNVDPLDYTDPGADAIVSRVLAGTRSGSIISLHTLYSGTAEALPRVISGLRARGLQPVAASRLLPRAHEGRSS
jgi:peptidoglycan/xylan/chitin deacetylase (PgdA/CDA1 family)